MTHRPTAVYRTYMHSNLRKLFFKKVATYETIGNLNIDIMKEIIGVFQVGQYYNDYVFRKSSYIF